MNAACIVGGLGLGGSLGPARADGPGEAGAADDASVAKEVVTAGSAEPTVREILVETGTRTVHRLEDAPVEVEVIDREQIDRSASDNLAELLEESSGLRVTRSFAGVGVQMEGLDDRYTLILVDGERVAGRVGGVVDLRRLSTAQVERVEIARGAQSTIYGADAVAGVINIITRAPDAGLGGELRLRAGTRESVDATARFDMGWSRVRASIFGGHHRAQGWRIDPQRIDTVGDDQRQSDLGVRLDLGSTRRLRARARSEYSLRDRVGIDLNEAGAVLDRRNRSESTQSSLRIDGEQAAWRWRVTGGHAFWRDQYAVDQRGDSALDVYEVAKDHVGRLATQLDIDVASQTLSVGVESQFETLATPRLESDDAFRARGAVYVQDEWRAKLDVDLRLLPGLRLDYDSRFGLAFTPRAGLALRPVETLRLRASYGMGYRAPTFREMYLSFDNLAVGYVVRGNEDLEPERAWSFNSDLSYTPNDRLEFHARIYDVQLRGLITTDLVDDGPGQGQQFGYVNIGSASTRGVGTGFAFTCAGGIQFGLDYELLDARNTSDGRPLPGRARHSGQANFSYALGPAPWTTSFTTRAALTGRRVFAASTEQGETTQARPFVSWDLQFRQRLAEHFGAFMGVENLLGAGDADTNPLPPRTFFLGLESRLGPRAWRPNPR